MRKLAAICAVITMMLAVGNVNATSFATKPILGTAATPQENGDIHMEADSGIICIPAYQNSPCGGNGVSMNIFEANPETGLAAVAHGSSVNIDVSLGYTISALWYLNGELQIDGGYVAFPNDSGPDYELFWGTEWELGIGDWTYTETWTNTLDTITYTTYFTIIPEPATIAILTLGGLLLRRKK